MIKIQAIIDETGILDMFILELSFHEKRCNHYDVLRLIVGIIGSEVKLNLLMR